MNSAPQKDVIYIDVEDDITAIIGKLKESKKSIVALVPPKRIGVLQSAVNLRLLARAASQNDKRLVIITGNTALSSLAASAKIPVAKNLQSKPELGEIAALDIDNGEEIIDGAQLPVGEHARQASMGDEDIEAASAMGAAAITGVNEQQAEGAASISKRRKSKVPNFDTFRKKLFIGGALGAILIAFFVWAIWFAPHATVYLSTRTTNASVSQQVTLGTDLTTEASKTTIKAEAKTSTEKISIPFDATGEKNVGEKATAEVEFSQQSLGERTVPAGTKLESESGLIFVTDSEVIVPASTIGPGCFPTACPGVATVEVTASGAGEEYNGVSGNLDGAGSGIEASFTGSSSGGTDKIVGAVKKSDLDKAKQQIDDNIDEEVARQELSKQFGEGYFVIADSFQADTSKLASSVKVDGEAKDGKAALEGDVTYTLYAVSKVELDKYLEEVVAQQIDNPDEQKIYSNGIDQATFTNVKYNGKSLTAALTASGEIGPKIDESEVRKIATGKNFGEIQQALESITGVDSVDTQLSPFWVTRAPENADKISVEFRLNE